MQGSAHSIFVQRIFKAAALNIKMVWRKNVRRARKVMRRKWKTRVKAKARKLVGSVYRFKRLTREVRLAHFAGAAANQFTTEDPANITNQAITVPAGLWFAESMPNTFQNQFACVHRLDQLEVPGDFTNLFDRYKITGVKATFLYQISDASPTGGAVLPTILYATDYDDDIVPAYSLMRQKQNVKQRILTANKPFSIFYRPRLSGVATANGISTPGAIVGQKGWLDTAVPNADYYGLKFSINNMYSTLSVNTQLEIKFTYYIAMKDPQ